MWAWAGGRGGRRKEGRLVKDCEKPSEWEPMYEGGGGGVGGEEEEEEEEEGRGGRGSV